MTYRTVFIRCIIIMIIIMAIAAVVALWPRPAKAQTVSCVDKDAFTQSLRTGYDERPVAQAEMSTGNAAVLYVNRETLTWTLAVILADRPLACPLVAGEGWQAIPQESH